MLWCSSLQPKADARGGEKADGRRGRGWKESEKLSRLVVVKDTTKPGELLQELEAT